MSPRVLATATALAISSLFLYTTAGAAEPELLMREGTTITVATEIGELTIGAGKSIERRYTWDGCSLDADMVRRGARWYGSLGIYDRQVASTCLANE